MQTKKNIEIRPWGSFEILFENKSCKIKRIKVNPGGRLSYQYHKKRSEAWTIIQGNAIVTLDGNEIKNKKGDTITIPKGAKHRVQNNKNEVLVFIEVQTGEYFGEDDIVRIKDDYGRK